MSKTPHDLVQELKTATLKALQCTSSLEWWSNVLLVVEIRDELLHMQTFSFPPAGENPAQNLQDFSHWLHNFPGAFVNPAIEFKPHPIAGNGVFVKENCKVDKSDAVFKIPLSMCIGLNPLPLEKMKRNRVVQSNPTFELALLLLDACKNPTFQPYVNILPRNFPTLPLTWSRKELELVQDLNVAIVIGGRILDVCLAFCHFFQEEFLTNLPDFLWAVSVCFTRQNPGPNGKVVLVPGFDMCNHDPDLTEISTELDANRAEFHSMAGKNFQANQEVTIFYGPRPNDEFLCFSGFVVPNSKNVHSKVILPFTLQVGTPVQHVLLSKVPSVSLAGGNLYLCTLGFDNAHALLAFSRADCAETKEEVAFALKRKLAGSNEYTEKERHHAVQLLREQRDHIQSRQSGPHDEHCRPQVVVVVQELRDSVVSLLDSLIQQLME